MQPSSLVPGSGAVPGGLHADALVVLRGERLVLDGLGLHVPPGGALLLHGPNGAGKTTLLRLLAGLGRPDAGTIRWNGTASEPPPVAFLGHSDALKPGLTLRENLELFARLHGGSVPEALDAMGLAALAGLPARLLSAGQKRRAALARLLLAPAARIWLLDEPSLGLDAAAVDRLGTVLARHRAGGGIVIAATHVPLPLPGAAVLRLDAPEAGLALPGPPDRTTDPGPAVPAPGPAARFAAVLGRELRLAFRHGADTLGAILFFLLAGALFPLALGPSPELLRRMAPGILWVCALLAALLPLDRLFGADGEDGTLDQLMLAGLPVPALALAKMAGHWLTTGLPVLLAAAPLALMLGLPDAALPATLLGLGLGTAALSLLGGMGAAIVLGARRGGVLLPLLVLPLATPALIFGAAASDAAIGGLEPRPDLLLLAAFVAAALPLCPLAASAGLRAATD